MNERATASAPATSANLGPLFDSLGLALAPRCVVHAEPASDWSASHVGEHRLASGQADGVIAAAQKAVGDRPLSLEVDNAVPIGRGLGSSAASFVAGAAAALRAVGDDASPDRVYRIAAEMEGHADQPAAAVYGGLVLVPAEGMPIRLPFHPSLRVVIAVPDTTQPTHEARAVLPDSYERAAVIRSAARAASLAAGLITGDPDLLASAHGDEIHEAPRQHLSPEVGELMEIARRAGAIHTARSGAGPSVVALTTADASDNVAAGFQSWGAQVIEGVEPRGLV